MINLSAYTALKDIILFQSYVQFVVHLQWSNDGIGPVSVNMAGICKNTGR